MEDAAEKMWTMQLRRIKKTDTEPCTRKKHWQKKQRCVNESNICKRTGLVNKIFVKMKTFIAMDKDSSYVFVIDCTFVGICKEHH